MPQFEFSTFASQLFWLYTSFALMLILLSIFAIPKIGGVLEARQKRIDSDLDKAAQMKSEAEAAIAAYEKALTASRAEAHKILSANAHAIAEQAEARNRALGEKLAEQIRVGETRIHAARDEAMAQIREISSGVARDAVEKLTGQSVDDAKLAKAIGGQG